MKAEAVLLSFKEIVFEISCTVTVKALSWYTFVLFFSYFFVHLELFNTIFGSGTLIGRNINKGLCLTGVMFFYLCVILLLRLI